MNNQKSQDTKWVYYPKKSDDLLTQLLINRQIKKEKWPKFMKPDFNTGLHNPYLLSDMEKAVRRIKKACENKETVAVFGDYDADGIPAAALLSDVLEKYGLKVIVYIPSRHEGYGLNEIALEKIATNNVTLMITVDLGIREFKNIQYAQSLGVDVIVTDHHEPGKILPPAFAVINPKRVNSKYPFRELSGGGVAFKLVQALGQKLGQISQTDLKWMLDLVGITTICDVVPLIDENRIFAKYGLIVLKKTHRLGLKKLYLAAGIDAEKIDTYIVGFQIGPRLNAPGRIENALKSLDLLRANDAKIASDLAEELNAINLRRQNQIEVMVKIAQEIIIKDKLDKEKVIIVRSKGFTGGLIGLVANKITEQYSRPCIIFEEGEVYSKGSSRSIEEFDLVENLEKLSELLVNFGGHKRAAGLSVANQNYSEFVKEIQKLANEQLTADDLIPKLKIDLEIKPTDLTLSNVDKITKLEPFGLGNPRPVFCLKNAQIDDVRLIGKDQNHLKFKVSDCDAIGFGLADFKTELEKAKRVDLAFNLNEDSWDGRRKVQLKVVNLRIS